MKKTLLRRVALLGLPLALTAGLIGGATAQGGLGQECYTLEWCPT